MAIFRIQGTITTITQSELLTAVSWFATNYEGKVERADAAGDTLQLNFAINEDSYANASATLSSIQTQFGALLGSNWSLTYVK